MSHSPNKTKFLEDLSRAVDEFVDRSFIHVIIISHNDADGISCLHIIQNLLYKIHINYDYFIYNRSISWENYLQGILSSRQSEKNAFIFTDVGSNLKELIPIIKKRKEYFFILDHHEVEDDIQFDRIPENLFFINPTIYGYDGLEHIAGATLTYMFAKQVNLSIIKEGLILYGSMHDSVKNSLKYSILPFLSRFGGESDQNINSFLNTLQIDPRKKIVDLDESEIKRIQNEIENVSPGRYALLPHKSGLLKHAFEHAILLNILCFKNISAAISIIQLNSITRYANNIYSEYIEDLSRNLRTISNDIPKFETKKAIFLEVKGRIPPSNWSDTASFSAVNELFDPNKVLFLGGLEKKSGTIKLSVRCSRKYLDKNKTNGINKIITKIKREFGGVGGGHKLAGGIRLSSPSYNLLKNKIDEFI
jgi:ribosomal protein S13